MRVSINLNVGSSEKVSNIIAKDIWFFVDKSVLKIVKLSDDFFNVFEHGVKKSLELLLAFHVENVNFHLIQLNQDLCTDLLNLVDLLISILVKSKD